MSTETKVEISPNQNHLEVPIRIEGEFPLRHETKAEFQCRVAIAQITTDPGDIEGNTD